MGPGPGPVVGRGFSALDSGAGFPMLKVVSKSTIPRPYEQLWWVLASEPSLFQGFSVFPWKSNSFTRNEAQEQHSLLDTTFEYISLNMRLAFRVLTSIW